MKRNICMIGICILLFALPIGMWLISDRASKQLYEDTFISMDTPMKLSAYGPKGKVIVNESKKKVDEINEMASPTIATSDVSKINKAAGKNYVKVHPEIIKMLVLSQKYSKISNGVWDISVGPLVNLWAIGTDKAKKPSDIDIKSKLPLIDYNKIKINEKDNSVMLMETGMAIDLGGIAKGFAVDEVDKIYKKYNAENGLIDLGSSSIYGIGKNGKNSPWSIGIKHPRSNGSDKYIGIIKISNQGISTSGDYQRYFIQNGKRYHHIISPSTGYPVDNGVMSVTVIVDGSVPDNGMLADILSLTVFGLGPDKGIKLINSMPNVSCIVTTTNFKIYRSSGFKDKIINLNEDFKFVN
ncbi:FAD:protein FMN transferase [Clostridium estertheticum]|uniref:FAD:protein FMN transferase n=1 Tax=Clostridium estertheticum TaxID=238834 RepID=UPI001CF4EB78|nr:FAD:protein FMN transferase [Clostridium estertheticum]MCB2307210.1 FAD:protein FMN transferase [Clostridium estertheticum]MCB2344138.1 FAD:protein FMN transferase [Clostridium estertheticum]MCB2348248.1 FAD:protein FMN transferase [Clostridium estertheticum]WAG45881.1 FAD:protein FMN transferase [Clostridium estertheticum]